MKTTIKIFAALIFIAYICMLIGCSVYFYTLDGPIDPFHRIVFVTVPIVGVFTSLSPMLLWKAAVLISKAILNFFVVMEPEIMKGEV